MRTYTNNRTYSNPTMSNTTTTCFRSSSKVIEQQQIVNNQLTNIQTDTKVITPNIIKNKTSTWNNFKKYIQNLFGTK
jgi:hypothetical protein